MSRIRNRIFRIISALAVVALFLALPSRGQQTPVFFRIISTTNSVITGFAADGILVWTNADTAGVTCTVQRALASPGPSNWADYAHQAVTNAAMSLWLFDPNPPAGMILIPGGINVGTAPGYGAYSLAEDAFYMDRYEVTKALWDEVYVWAVTNGYAFDNAGAGKAPDHPVHTVSWYDCLKWCNARSEKGGRVPAYYRDGSYAVVYRAGPEYWEPVLEPFIDTSADGYRLPADTQWQYAARGGLLNKRYPWGDVLDHDHANYYGETRYTDGGYPYTSPVGSFEAGKNGYGLYDMAGNVFEWCFDWHIAFDLRILHGGGWTLPSNTCEVAGRLLTAPDNAKDICGFRTVLPSARQ